MKYHIYFVRLIKKIIHLNNLAKYNEIIKLCNLLICKELEMKFITIANETNVLFFKNMFLKKLFNIFKREYKILYPLFIAILLLYYMFFKKIKHYNYILNIKKVYI